jgi:hypothetical protein
MRLSRYWARLHRLTELRRDAKSEFTRNKRGPGGFGLTSYPSPFARP